MSDVTSKITSSESAFFFKNYKQGFLSRDLAIDEEMKKKLRRQWEPLPTLIKEKEPLWYRVPYSSSTAKGKGKISGDREGCRLGLKPAPDESWQ